MLTIGPFYAALNRNDACIGSYGTKSWLPWSVGVALRRADGVFDPSLCVSIGTVDEPCGFSHTLICSRRKPNGYRMMRAVVGGANPKLLRWL